MACFGSPTMNSLPGAGRTSSARRARRIVGGEQQQDLGLNRIGVLELVDEDARELLLQVRAALPALFRIRSRARASRSAKSSAPAARLQRLVPIGRAGELLLQAARRGRRRRRCLELLEIGEERVARGEHLGPRHVRSELVAAPLPRPREAAIAHEIDEPRLPPVEIALAERLLELGSGGSAGGRPSVSMKRLSRGDVGGAVRSARRWSAAMRRSISPSRSNGGRRHGRREVAPLGQRRGRRGEADRSDRRRPPPPNDGALVRRSARRSAFGRILQRLLEPGAEGARVQPVGLRLGQHGEERIDARLDRPLAEQFRAEAVDGVDVRLLERLERVLETRRRARRSACGRDRRALLLERLAQAQLQLAGGLFGERHGDDLVHRRAAGREHAEDAVDELGRLAGAGRGFDDERVVEIRRRSRGAPRRRRGRDAGVIASTSARSDRPGRSGSCGPPAPLRAARRPSGSRTTGTRPSQGRPARNPRSTARSTIASAWRPCPRV